MIRSEDVRYYALSILMPMLLLAATTYGAGMLVMGRPTGEAAVNRALAAGRTSLGNTLTDLGSSLSDTPYIVALTVAAVIALRLRHGAWREPIFLIAAVWSQSLIFLATTELVGRHRPPVRHLDEAPPTSSFPSGHVSAAVAFYCGLALILATRARGRPARVAIWVLAVAAVLVVSFSRLYRGLHFVTDVVWGLLLGAGCLVMAARAILHRPRVTAEPGVTAGPR
ncbi:phosphatase PAP2 family protein [Nonomuraea sp. NPDC049709]|uniref:phosphatase PAP2 family protein n=1 Tax=Nonomuraea sp. NPDC049709 TaxID=3154736 RepID=UPI0034341C3F